MRTILNFNTDMVDGSAPAVKEGRPSEALFRMGECASGEGPRWGKALALAVVVHAGVLAAGLLLPSARPEKAVSPEPELVFITFAAPPPAPSQGGAAAAVPERQPRQARSRPQRTERPVVVPVPKPVPEPVETKPEPVPEPAVEAASAEPVPEAAPSAAPEQGGAGAVIGGVVGGVVGGREGGVVGAPVSGGTGDAVGLKQVLRAPAVLKQVTPEYPRRARADGIQGLVLVRIIIGTDGRVEPANTRVLRSVPALDEAAIAAVSRWRFSPAIGRDGRPVRVIIELPVQFSLK